MDREELIKFIIWTMTHYGSEALERANKGARLQQQAELIADFIEQWHEASELIRDFHLVKIVGRR